MMGITSAEKASNQSSDKLLQILECIAENHFPVKLQELSEQVNMSQSTVLRYLYALQRTNYVYQDADTSRYALTWKICKLTENVNSNLSLRNISSPLINQLAGALQLGVCLVVDQNHECMYLDCVDNPQALGTTMQRIGKCAPLHATGSGKVLLSSYTDAQIDAYIAEVGLPHITEYTITNREDLLQELAKVRQQGFGTDIEECEIGLRCISIPIVDYSGRIVASMSVFGNLTQMTDQRIEQDIYPMLRDVTGAISSRLGYALS